MTNQTLNPQEWEQRYQDNNTPWIHHAELTALLLEVKSVLPAGSSILDVGCGLGEEALALAEAGFNVTGIDLSPTAIAKANANRPAHLKLNFEVANILELELPTQHYDAVVEVCVLHAQRSDPERARFVAALRQQLAPNGYWFHISCVKPDIVAVAEQYQVDPPPGLRDECFVEHVQDYFEVISQARIDYAIKRDSQPLVPFPARMMVLRKSNRCCQRSDC